ncbi:ribonucleases P/MRP protein subunit POP1 [Cimex lectularius]|uniref:Uncharacterized protein n=1 Tax=Cimex lectularius TaxID=79782 RepID=A0A8I6STM8_CIMLE|nr:ribonucleases P/MRP protein subunit POP1 [Cimex lectularius]XP_024085314.1 ribonucleases P/MRP protein subunit POP1 [Cimex lectularius]
MDENKGDTDEVPKSVVVGSMVKNSLDEINALLYILENPTSGLATKKKLPNHMRRRAMSHNIKRIPKRLRETYQALREKSNTREGKGKVPRGKYRRRPKDLVKDYSRRQNRNLWLETHIWHAKRFFMATKWGYKVPLRPADKSYRACYRAAANHCLIQDISYYNCLEISGNLDVIMSGLKRHVNKEESVDSAFLLNGSREGSVFFYRRDSYPRGAIGEVKFFWRPGDPKKIWLWVHPSFFDELIDEFVGTFCLSQIDLIDKQSDKLPRRILRIYSGDVQMKNIILNRFRLLGPMSQAIVSKALIPLQCENRIIEDWVSEFYNQDNKNSLKEQEQYWDKMKLFTSPAQLTPRIIVPITIYDTRITLPEFRTKAKNESISTEEVKLEDLTSPIWDDVLRERITEERLTPKKIDEIRSQKLVPGVNFETGKKINVNVNSPAFPVLAIQSPGSQSSEKRLGFGCGWDLICPAGYGMAVWLSLILNGGRAGGLREAESHLREAASLGIPPDTLSGQWEDKQKKDEAKARHFRIPPAKRPNYVKLGVPSPFHAPWHLLVREWSSTEDFYILRDNRILRELRQNLKTGVLPDVQPGTLIGVHLVFEGKGLLSDNAHICIPKDDDYVPPVEPGHEDTNKTPRKECTLEHKSVLKRLARKRKNIKQNEEQNDAYSSAKIIEEQKERIQSLWLPDCSRVRDHCSRPIFGFVVNGDFSFTEAKSSGLGYVTYEGLKELGKNKIKNRVLVRTTNTLQYRFAYLEIVIK